MTLKYLYLTRFINNIFITTINKIVKIINFHYNGSFYTENFLNIRTNL